MIIPICFSAVEIFASHFCIEKLQMKLSSFPNYKHGYIFISNSFLIRQSCKLLRVYRCESDTVIFILSVI